MNIIRKSIYKSVPLYGLVKEVLYYRDIIKTPVRVAEKDIVVCGMQRSGSTLLYNLLNKMIALKVNPAQGFFYYTHDYVEKINQPNYFFLRKTHNYTVFLKRRIANKSSLAFYTHRNLLDVIASFKQKGWAPDVHDFVVNGSLDQIVSEAILYGQLKNIVLIPYNDLYLNKSAIIHKLAKHLKIVLAKKEVEQLVEETSVVKTKEKMSTLVYEDHGGRNLVNDDTGLHANHINNPAPQKWKSVLTNEEIKLVQTSSAYKKYCKFFNYNLT